MDIWWQVEMEYHIEKVRIDNHFFEVRYPIKKILYHGKSDFQDILVADSSFGKILVLDGVLQLSTYDEEIYHKALTLPAVKRTFRKILILGGGDGGAARELLNAHPYVKIDVVDIDPEVTKVVRKYIPEVENNVFDSHNVTLINEDAFKYVENVPYDYDYIIGDLTDLRYEDEAGNQVNRLYMENFLLKLKKILSEDGIITYHLGGYNLDRPLINQAFKIFSKIFKYTRLYGVFIPSFLDLWCFISVSNRKFKLNKRIVEVWDIKNVG